MYKCIDTLLLYQKKAPDSPYMFSPGETTEPDSHHEGPFVDTALRRIRSLASTWRFPASSWNTPGGPWGFRVYRAWGPWGSGVIRAWWGL